MVSDNSAYSYQSDFKKMLNHIEVYTENTTENTETTEQPAEESTETESTSGGISPEFKEAMDSYEAFIDEYCEFMEKYSNGETTTEMLLEYADYVSQLAEMEEKFDEWEDDDMTDEELQYYLEVQARVTEKLANVSISID